MLSNEKASFSHDRRRLRLSVRPPRRTLVTALAALALLAWWLAGREGGIAAALPTLAALGLGAQRLLPLLQTVNHSLNALTSAAPIQERIAALRNASPDGHAVRQGVVA